jgi:hypothetical protein
MMPTYTFKHKETGEILEQFMTISDRTSFLETHPEYEQVILAAPALGDPAALGYLKPPTDFMKYVRDPIITRNRGKKSTRYQTPKEI